jgi:hypothetical protein
MTWDWWVCLAVSLTIVVVPAFWLLLRNPMKGYDGSQIGGE